MTTATRDDWRRTVEEAVAAEVRFRRRVWTYFRAVFAMQALLAVCFLIHTLSHH